MMNDKLYFKFSFRTRISAADIMGLYWSGKLDEKTSALQGTQLLQDSHKTLRLMNGLTLSTRTLGAVSYDFSGRSQISIWTKSCESIVENSAALVVNSETKIEVGEPKAVNPLQGDISY